MRIPGLPADKAGDSLLAWYPEGDACAADQVLAVSAAFPLSSVVQGRSSRSQPSATPNTSSPSPAPGPERDAGRVGSRSAPSQQEQGRFQPHQVTAQEQASKAKGNLMLFFFL